MAAALVSKLARDALVGDMGAKHITSFPVYNSYPTSYVWSE